MRLDNKQYKKIFIFFIIFIEVALSGCVIAPRRSPAEIAAEQARLEQQLAPMQQNFDTLNANEKKWEATHPKEAAERQRLIQQDKDDYDSNAAYEQRQQMIREQQKPKPQSMCAAPVGSGPNGIIMGMIPCN